MRARDREGDVGPALAAELLEQGRPVTLRARGMSMRPLIHDGDLLTLAPLGWPVRVGDVVVALCMGRLLVHRVVRLEEEGAGERAGMAALLQGDAHWSPDGSFVYQQLVCKPSGAAPIQASLADSPASPDRIVGRAVAQRRGAQVLGAWRLGGPLSRIWLVALPLVRALRGLWRRVSNLRAARAS